MFKRTNNAVRTQAAGECSVIADRSRNNKKYLLGVWIGSFNKARGSISPCCQCILRLVTSLTVCT